MAHYFYRWHFNDVQPFDNWSEPQMRTCGLSKN